MKSGRGVASTLHLQMGQEVMYLLLATSLLANFVFASLAVRNARLNEAATERPSIDVLRENQLLRRQQEQQAAEIVSLRSQLEMLRLPAQTAEAKEQPPIIMLRDADGFSFDAGSAELSRGFLAKIPEVVKRIVSLSDQYGAQVVEVIGHTDGTSINEEMRGKANLDDTLRQSLDLGSSVVLFPNDNVGLGISRAVNVARVLRMSGLPARLDIQPLSAAYLIAPNDRTDPAARRRDDASRRRIEIRLRRINSNQAATYQP